MTVNPVMENKVLNAKVEGKIDISTSGDFEAQVIEAAKGAEQIVLDFEDVPYISSAGLRALLNIQKFMNNDNVKIVKVRNDVMEIFKITGFCDIFEIE